MSSTKLPEQKHLSNALKIIKEKAGYDLPVEAVFLLLLISEHEEISTKKLSQLSQIPLGRCYSLTARLSDSRGFFWKGLRYVVRTSRIIDGKRVMDCKLSPAGEEFIREFTA